MNDLPNNVAGPLYGLAASDQRLSRMVGGKLGADGAVAVFLLHVGGTANELVACFVIDEQRRIAAEIGHGAIDDGMILELGHARQFPTRVTTPSFTVILASP